MNLLNYKYYMDNKNILNESINSSIINNILKTPEFILNTLYKDSIYSKNLNKLLETLNTMYKNLCSDNKVSFVSNIETVINSIDIEAAKELYNYTDDDILLIINNINKLVLKIRNILLRLNSNTNNIYESLINALPTTYHRFVSSLTDNDFIKLKVSDIKKNNSEKYKNLILTSPLVLYYSVNDNFLGVSNTHDNLVKFNDYDNINKATAEWYNLINNIINKGIKLLCVLSFHGQKLYALPNDDLKKLVNIYFRYDFRCSNILTIKYYSPNIRNGIVLTSNYSKTNRLYTILLWGTSDDDYCYICTRPIDPYRTRADHTKDTDTKTRYKWKKDARGIIIPYLTVINNYIDIIKALNDENDDVFNKIYLNNIKNIRTTKYKTTQGLKKFKNDVNIFNTIKQETIELLEQFLNLLKNNKFNDSLGSFDFDKLLLHNNLMELFIELQNMITDIPRYLKNASTEISNPNHYLFNVLDTTFKEVNTQIQNIKSYLLNNNIN